MEAVAWNVTYKKDKDTVTISHSNTIQGNEKVKPDSINYKDRSYSAGIKSIKSTQDSQEAKYIASMQVKQSVYEAVDNITERIKELMDPTAGMTEEEKASYDKRVMTKVYSGKELTAEELRYIRMNYPALYPYVMRVQIQRKALEERLKHCNSKEEAQDIFNEAMAGISEDDPAKTMLIAAYKDVYEEFMESDDYKGLPETEEEAEEEENKQCNNKTEDNKKDEDNIKNAEELLSAIPQKIENSYTYK